MAAVITEFARKRVFASDVFDYGYGTAPHDFLHDDPLIRPYWVVTNLHVELRGGRCTRDWIARSGHP
jgi:hypothetical protein